MAYYPVIGGPIAPYSNVPIEPQFYQPSQFVITAISLGATTAITMANGTNNVAPNYVIGQEVRLIIPPSFGSRQLNGQSGYVLSIPSANQVELAINSIGVDSFILSSDPTQAQILAIGDISSGPINSSGRVNQGTFIPGSFINVSP
jgi:hypothetical protein